LRYPISVDASGNYKLSARFSTPKSGRSIQFKLDGNLIGGEVQTPNTGGWQAWDDATTEVYLPKGDHELEVEFMSNELNLNYIDIVKSQTDTEQWSLVWQDEFNGNSIDSTKWEHEVNGAGGGNNELQYYTARSENSYVANGRLVLKALKERYTGSDGTKDYTSARLRTKNKGDFLYGKIDVKAKLPHGQGLWPAIWMLPTDNVYGGWAASGEIDIMEAVNLRVNNNNEIHGTIHYGGEWPAQTHTGLGIVPGSSVVDNYHVYGIEWEPGEIRWYLDGVLYQTQTDWYSNAGTYPAPFNQRFHLLLNVAVGGNWPGSPNNSTSFPQTMEVDYVRVYESKQGGGDTVSLSVLNEGGGVVSANNNDINCGDRCSQQYTEFTAVELTATAEDGFIFNGWNDPALCATAYQNVCIVEMAPGNSDITLQAFFAPDNSCSQTSPHNGAAVLIPGTVQAENYDVGCAELAYSDTDSENQGGKYREDEVDIETSHDNGGGYNVGWLRDGEWLNYTVNVSEAGRYDINFRTASKGNGSNVYLSKNGKNITGDIRISNTGGWQNWKTVTKKGIDLDAGLQTLTLHIDDGDFNLNFFEIVKAGTNTGPFVVDKSRGEWTLVVIPDTQHYSQNRDNAPIANMRKAFDWIVDVKDDLNIQFVQGLGDITESWNNGWEWDNSTSAWDKLYGQVPFMPIVGNHDDPWTMNRYFPVSSFSSEYWWGGDYGSVENNYGLMTIGNEDYMFLQVETYDQYSDYHQAGIDWAKGILGAYPNRRVILATHDTWATNHIKNNLLNNYDNIVLSNAGHVCQREALYTTSGPRGGVSHNFIVDYQCDAQEVMLLRYYVFKPMEDKVEYFTYSPVTEQFEVDSSSQGAFSLYQNNP